MGVPRHVARTRCAATGTPRLLVAPCETLAQPLLLHAHRLDGGAGLLDHARGPHDVHGAPRLDLAFAAHEDALAGANIRRARHDGPALGDIGGGVRPGRRADLEHVARRHIAVEPHPRALKPGLVDATDFEPLVDGALDAHEPRAGGRMAAEQVPVGEPPAKGPGELGLERIELRLPQRRPRKHGVQRPPIATHDVVDVIGALHATLDLEGRHPGAHELLHMADAQVIARAQQAIALSPPAGPRRVAPPRPAGKDAPAAVLQLVGQAARLRAIPPVRRPAAHDGGVRARPGIADANRPVAKRLDGNALGTQPPQLGARQLTRARHPPNAQLARGKAHCWRRLRPRLGGQVKLDMGQLASQHGAQADIRDDERVGTRGGRRGGELDGGGTFAIAQAHVERHVDARSAGMREHAPARQLVEGEPAVRRAGVERAQPHVHGIGPRRDRRAQRIRRPRRRQQLDPLSHMRPFSSRTAPCPPKQSRPLGTRIHLRVFSRK